MKKQMQQFKRVLAGFMSAAMVFTMVPQTAFAEEIETYAEQDEMLTEEATYVETEVATEEAETYIAEAEEYSVEAMEVALEEEATKEYFKIDLSSVDEDLEYKAITGAYKKDADNYVVSADGLYVEKGTRVEFTLTVKEDKKETKEILKKSVTVSANGIEKIPGTGFTTENVIDVDIPNVTDNIKVVAQTTDIHTITFNTGIYAEEIEPFKFSGNLEANPRVPIIAKEGYAIEVTYKYGASATYPLTVEGGKYTIPVLSDDVVRDADFTVDVTGKKTTYVLSANSAIVYGIGHTPLAAGETVDITAGADLRIGAVAESGKAIYAFVVSINGKDKTYYDEAGGIIIPGSDVTGDVYIKEIKSTVARYYVDYYGVSYTVVSGNDATKAGENYDFVVAPVPGYDKVVLKYSVDGGVTDKKLEWNKDNKYSISANDIVGDIEIEEVTDECVKSKYSVTLTKAAADIAVKVLSDNGIDEVTLVANKAVTGVAEHGRDYTFKVVDAKSADRDAPTVTATCNGNPVVVTNTGDTYTIDSKYVQGNIAITVVPATTKSVNVSVVSANNVTVTAAATAPMKKDFTFKVTPNAGYKLVSVTAVVSGNAIKFKKGLSENSLAGDFTIAAADIKGDISISVHAIKKDVTINVVSANAIVKPNDATPATIVDGKWTVKAKESFKFDVADNGKYVVTEVGIQGKYYKKLGSAAGTYTISAEEITDDFTIVVKTGVEYTLDYNETLVSVTASTGNKLVPVVGKKFVLANDATDVTLTAALADGAYNVYGSVKVPAYKLDGTSVSINGIAKGKLDANNRITIKKDAIDGDIRIAAEEIENVALLKDGSFYEGAYNNIAVDKTKYTSYKLVECKGKTPVSVNTTDKHVNAETGVITFTDADAGKAIAIKVKVNGKDVTYTFKVAAAVKSLTIKGFKANKATQNAGATVTYEVVPTPANADLTGLVVSVNGLGLDYHVDDMKSFAITAPVKPEGKITVTAQTPDSAKYEGEITTSYDAVKKAVPTVALMYATDNDLNITIGAPKTVDVANTTGLYYIVSANKLVDKKPEATPSYTVTVPATTTNVKAVVNAGKAEDYQVTVTLVQVDGVDILAQAKTVTKTMSTLNPYIETKIGVTKKTVKLTQGDTGVNIAVAKFSKKATWVDTLGKVPEVVSMPAYATLSDVVVTSGLGTSVYVDVDPYAPAGKYVIRLTAAAPADVIPSTVDVTITVAERINFAGTAYLAIANNQIYKPAGKAVTNTVKVLANKGINTKKVELSLAAGTPAGITLKNGKITVDKNYVVRGNHADGVDEITVNAKATDCAYNIANPETASISFFVTSNAVAPADIRVDGSSMDGKTYSYRTLDGNYVKVVDGCENEISSNDYTFKSSSKNLVVASDGQIISVKPGKYTLTATANDGSKNKKVVKFSVGYSSSALVLGAESTYTGDPIINEGDYVGVNTHNILFPVEVWIAAEDDEAINASYTIKGGKIIDKYSYSDIMGFIFEPTAEVTEIAVTNKATKAKNVYKINNVNYKRQVAFKTPTVKNTSGKIYAGMQDGKIQNIELTVSKLPEIADDERLVALISWDFAPSSYVRGYYEFCTAAGIPGYTLFDVVDGKITIPVSNCATNDVIAGNYKFNVEFWKVDRITGATLDTIGKPASFKVNVLKTPKSSYKLTTSYKFGNKGVVAPGAYAPLTGKATFCTANLKGTGVKCAELYNANINGTANNFKDYFEIDALGNLVVKDGKTNVFTDKNLKNNLTGYVVYYVTDSITGAETKMTTKITCKK